MENEKMIKIDEEEKKKPHILLSMQAIMLEDQKSNPDINVHNLTRLYRYKKSEIDINKFLNAFNSTFKHHPIFLTVLHKNEDGSVVQVYRPDLFKEIQLIKLTEKEMNQKINQKIYTNFQFQLYEHLLVNFKVYETEHYLYQFIDHHHIMMDGYTLKLMQETLKRFYFGETLEPDRYFLRLKEIEDEIAKPDYKEEKKFYQEIYGRSMPCGSPERVAGRIEIKGLDWYKFSIDNLMNQLKKIFGKNDTLYNNFFVMASMCAVAKDTGKNDIMVTWTYHGRPKGISRNCAGNFARIYPVRIKLDEPMKISEFARRVEIQSKNLLKRKYYPYLFEFEYDIDIMNNIYEKDFFDAGTLGDIKREIIKIPDRDLRKGIFINQCIDGVYIVNENKIDVEWQYPFSKFNEETMERFKNIFVKYCFKLAEHWNDDNKINIINLSD